jgi:hypothetical protein
MSISKQKEITMSVKEALQNGLARTLMATFKPTTNSKEKACMAALTLNGARTHVTAAQYYTKDIGDKQLQEKLSDALRAVDEAQAYIDNRLSKG